MTDPLMSQRTNGGGGSYSSAGLTWPRRIRPHSLSFKPLRSANPIQSPEANMDSPQAFLSPPIQQRSGYVSPLRAVRTLKEYDQEIDKLRKENFNLKLSLYFMEHDMEKLTNPKERETLKVNLELRIEAETLKNEVAVKNAQLYETMIAMEKLEEKLHLETLHSKEIQEKLEEKIEALKQELEKERMQTPRSSEASSEIYRQAFGIEDLVSGKSSPEHEMNLEEIRSQYMYELEKLRCTIDEKDKEIRNMRTVIEDLEKKNELFEEKVRKRNITIQGLCQYAKKKLNTDDPDHSQGAMQKSLNQATEAAKTGNKDGVISNLHDIEKGLNETLEEQINQRTRLRSFEDNADGGLSSIESVKVVPTSSNDVLEQECERLQKAVREKDLFIQELLDERSKMTLEHEKTVQSLVSQLQNQNEGESGKIRDSDIYDSESLKMLQERICENDAEINFRKKTIEMLNIQLAKCQSELQAAIISGEEKERKLLELSSHALNLENELTEMQHELQLLKAARQNNKKLMTDDNSDNVPKLNTGGITGLGSLKSTNVPEKKRASLNETKELRRSLEESIPVNMGGNENVELRGLHTVSSQGFRVDEQLLSDHPSVSGALPHGPSSPQKTSIARSKRMSDSFFLKTPRNDIIKLDINVHKKVIDGEKPEKSEDLLDIMENNIEKFERHRLLQQLKDQNIEIAKLGRHATVQEDMASVLADDKKQLQQEVEEKTLEIQKLTAGCSDLEKQVITLQGQLHIAVKKADELERIVRDSKSKIRTPIPKSSSASQTDSSRMIITQDSGCNTTFFDLEPSLSSYGQSDSVNTLKGEVCILILMVEEKENEILMHKQSINKLKSELKNVMIHSGNTSQLLSDFNEGLSVVHQELYQSQDINNHLLQHLQELARFMESLLSNEGKRKLDVSSLTPESVSWAMKHISDSIELSGNLSHNLSICEESRVFDFDETSRIINESLRHPQSEFLKSSRISWGTDEEFTSSSRRAEPAGSELQVVPHQQNADEAGKSRKHISVLQHKPTNETTVETFDSDQLTILGESCSEERVGCFNEQEVPDVVFSDEVQVVPKDEHCRCVQLPAAEVEMKTNYLSHMLKQSMQFESEFHFQHAIWYRQHKGKNVIPSCLWCQSKTDCIPPLRTYNKHHGVPFCNISSDSDIWSEPDRNLSLQRIGIDLEAPSFHLRSPPRRRKSTRDRHCSDDHSSDSSFPVNGSPKGKNIPRRKKIIGSFRRDTTELKLDTLVESRLLTLESSIADKLIYAEKLSQKIQDDVSSLAEFADANSLQAHTLMNINEEIGDLQSTLSHAMEEVKVLKGTTQEKSQLSQGHSLTEELKLYNEEILSKIDDIDQVKEILVKERCARETAEQNLFSCHRELSSVKQKLAETMQQLQEKSHVRHDRERISEVGSRELRPETLVVQEISDSTGTPVDLDHLRRSLAQEEERNMFLSKQVNDALNENKKLKMELEQLQSRLMSEQKDLEEIRQQLMSEQDTVKRLNREKKLSESKSHDLSANLMSVSSSVTELQDQNRVLNKQVNDLLNENKKLKLEVEESQMQLNSEREQLEKLGREHFHKQESLSQLSKGKLVTDNKITSLTAEVDALKIALSQKDDQISSLNKQVNDLENENWRIKKEVEQLEQRLRTEVEHLEAVRKAKNDLHKQTMDLVTQKGDLEKQLLFSEERMKVLADEKSDFSKQIFQEQRENKNLSDQLKILEEQKVMLERENNKYKTEIHSTDSVCDETRHDLKQTKEKMKKLELKLRQYENELTRVSAANEHLMSDKRSLTEELEASTSKITELGKQNGEVKKMLKEKTSSCNEIEREKNLLVDQIENLRVKKVQAESSRDHLLSDYDSLAMKVDSLERQLKDNELNLQKNKDEQEHLRQQTVSLQNKIKMKESVIKGLEEQHDVLQEQLKDLQHSLNKSDIDLKHLEDENHTLELQVITLQKNLKKTSSQLEMKDDEISHLQEDIFNLEQKIKDKEAAQKRVLEEKRASEDQALNLQQEVKKQESFHRNAKLQAQELEEHVYALEQQIHSKELLRKKSEDEAKSLQAKIEEKEKSVKKLESSLKKMEHKLLTFQDNNVQLQHRVDLSETARRFSEDQTTVFREELNKLREAMLTKAQKEELTSTDRLSLILNELNSKEEYCKVLESKVIEYQKQNLKLKREHDRATTPIKQFTESAVVSAEGTEVSLIPNKVFSEPRSSQDYRRHAESKLQVERDNIIKGLELDNSDLNYQIQILNHKFEMAEKAKRELEEENISLWKTLYGTEDEKTHIVKTLELKNDELKNRAEELEKRLEQSEKLQHDLEEEKDSLWKTLYGKQDEETDMIKRLEQKNKDFKDQLEDFQLKLREAEKSKQNLREEKDTLWKTVHGKKDEKTDIIKKLQLKNNDLKSEIEDLRKKLDACEKDKCAFEEERNSLWKTLYGQHDDKIDITKMLESKNNELKVKIEVLEKKLSHCEKAKFDIEEKKDTLWKSLYGSQDEKIEAMKMMERKNNDLKTQVAVLEKKLIDADKMRSELEEEKNSMWKKLCGKEDEETDLLQQMEIKNADLKGEIEVLKGELLLSEKSNKELEEEKSSLWKTLYGSEHEKADIIRNLEVKTKDLKGQLHILERKIGASENVKKDLEERIESLTATLYGSPDEKTDAVRTLALKNRALRTQVDSLKGEINDLQKHKTDLEEEKASIWKALCGHENENEKADVMRLMEQKNKDLSDEIDILQKKLSVSEKALKEVDDEKDALWKTLYGGEHEKTDIVKRLEQKNEDLLIQTGDLEKKLSASEKTQRSLEEEKASLWSALHGSDDEKTHEIKSLEMKNSDLKKQLQILEAKLGMSEKLKNDFEEEKNSLWKTMFGSQDEKAAAIKKLNMENCKLKSYIQDLEKKLDISEKAKNDLQAEVDSHDEKLLQSIEENANLKDKLELKDSELKNQIEMLTEKLKVSEDLKKAIEEDRNALYNQLLGDSTGTKLEGMLKETKVYADEVKKLEQEIEQKNALILEMKEKLYTSEHSLTTQKNIVEHMKNEIASFQVQLERAHAEREWFQNQYIDSQREVIRATQDTALAGGEVRVEDMMMIQSQNMDLKKQVTDLLSQVHEKDTSLSLPPVKTELFTIKLPTLPDAKVESSVERKPSLEMKHAELEKLHIEKNYLQKVLTDLKKQIETQPIKQPDSIQAEKFPVQKQPSDFSEDIAKQLAFHGFSDAAMKEIKQLQGERDYFKDLADNLQLRTSLPLRDAGPESYIEGENVKLRKENADLKGKMVQLHSRLKKREAMIRALSSKVVELSQYLKDREVSKEVNEFEKKTDSISLLASQIVEGSAKAAQRSLSEDIIVPDISSRDFDFEEDHQLLSFLHPSLRLSVSGESETQDLDAETVRKLRYQIEELENQLEDTKMDNYRLQEEVNTLLLEFGIQNNQLVCAKCGKSADITSAEPSVDVKPVSKFMPFRRYLEKDPAFSREESINKLSECKWKLQNEVLNMQKRLCANNPHYVENQEKFNNHIAKLVAMEFLKIPVRIFSEPLLHSAESRDIVKSAQHLEILWKNQVLHLERDINCLQNYRAFLEQFVLGLVKELSKATRKKPATLRRDADIEGETSQTSKFPQQVEDPVVPTAVELVEKSLSVQSLSFTPEYGIPPVQTMPSQEVQPPQGFSADEPWLQEQTPPIIPLVGDTVRMVKKPPAADQSKLKAEVSDLQNKIKDLNKKIEELQLENKKLLAENRMMSLECKKYHRIKSKDERQLQQEIEHLKHSLKDMTSVNKSMQVELSTYRQLLRTEEVSKDRPAEKQLDNYVKKCHVMKLLGEVKSLNSELSRVIQENSMLRKKISQLSSPASRTAKSRVLAKEESSSGKESEETVTLSPGESLTSLESDERYRMHAGKFEVPPDQYVPKSKHIRESEDLRGIPYDQNVLPFRTTQRRGKSYSIQDRSHFSSPDLGIESDPNHELHLSELAESDEKSSWKTRPSEEPTMPSKTKPRVPSEDSVAAICESLRTSIAAGVSLHAMGLLKDYNLLKKEIEESLVLVKSIYSRAKQCVEYLSRDANPNKNLGYTTLKDVLIILFDLNVCQVKAQQIIRCFWVSSVPSEAVDAAALLQENQELLRRLEIIMEERQRQKLELQQAFERLKEVQDSKQKMEKAIAKQLTRTKKVLKSANSNLQGPEQGQGAPSYVPPKRNPSASVKPSAK